jgi:DNA-binding response OmpR family regulator
MVELIARTKALLRRPGQALGTVLEAGTIIFDTIGRDVPKNVLEEKLYGIDEELGSNAIPVHVHHLRRKLLEAHAAAEIHTVRGIGYILADKVS